MRQDDTDKLTVGQVMTRAPYACHAEDSLMRAAQLMAQHDCGCLPVIDGHALVVGVVTDRDVCVAAAHERRALDAMLVGPHMTTHAHTCTPAATLERACALMRNHRVRRLVVVDDGGRLLGMLSLDDLAHARDRGELRADDIVDALASAAVARVYG